MDLACLAHACTLSNQNDFFPHLIIAVSGQYLTSPPPPNLSLSSSVQLSH